MRRGTGVAILTGGVYLSDSRCTSRRGSLSGRDVLPPADPPVDAPGDAPVDAPVDALDKVLRDGGA